MFTRWLSSRRRRFNTLSEQEILALAISSEEDDARIYRAYADALSGEYPASAKVFEEMANEEDEHRQLLIDQHQKRFGNVIPLLRREHISGYQERAADWLLRPLSLDKTRAIAQKMEQDAERFYVAAAATTTDASTRKLLGDLAHAESAHESLAQRLVAEHLTDEVREEEDNAAHKQFLLTYVQPGLAGLMDGSISTLAPIFAAAFATGQTWETFLIGLSASVGAGISMGFTEAAHDDGVLTGRGSPLKRGLASGIMTLVGGLGHTLPYLINDFRTATTVAIAIVFVELWAITYIQNKYMDTPWGRAMFQVLLGGSLVFAAGILIGHA